MKIVASVSTNAAFMKNIFFALSLFLFLTNNSFGQLEMDSITKSVEPQISNQRVEVICLCDVEASFPGGRTAMKNWIDNNIQYPKEPFTSPIEGKVYVYFIVDKDGSLSVEKIIGNKNEALRKEAKRLVSSMPNWLPGEYECKRRITYCRVPIEFSLI